MEILNGISVSGVMSATLRMATPLLFASLGGLFTARVGIINLALEGIMLMGAFLAFVGSFLSGSAVIGLACGMLGGVGTALILGFLSINGRANQTVAGVGINILALGITSYLLKVFFRTGEYLKAQTFSNWAIPGFTKIPFIGDVVFNQNFLVYLVFILVPIVWYVLYKTPAGLMIRATGEHPKAVDSLGGNVIKIRYLSVMVCGCLAGLGGAYLSIGQMGVFVENVTAGKGYIALATLIFGKFTPTGSLVAALIFGFAEGLQLRIQTAGSNIPFQFLSMLPYILTMIALTGFVKRSKAPASLGKPYSRQG